MDTITELPNRRLECRSWLHAWKHKHTEVLKDDWEGTLSMVLVCTRCTTEREDLITWETGLLYRRRYNYPTGYLLKNLEELGGRQALNIAVRKELVGRLIEETV
jgi:hypothetical protein